MILVAAMGVLLALLALFAASRVRGNGVRVLLIILALVFALPSVYLVLALHPELIDGRFRTYKAFYRDIQIGMTRAEVLAAMDRRYPKSGPRQSPKLMDDTPTSLGFFMNPETSTEPNCEGIFLKLENGRVKSKDYSAD